MGDRSGVLPLETAVLVTINNNAGVSIGMQAAQIHEGRTIAETQDVVACDVVFTHDLRIGRVVVPGDAPKFSGAPPLPAFRPAAIGEDNAEILDRRAGDLRGQVLASGE